MVDDLKLKCPQCGALRYIKIGRYPDGLCRVHCFECDHEQPHTNEEYYAEFFATSIVTVASPTLTDHFTDLTDKLKLLRDNPTATLDEDTPL